MPLYTFVHPETGEKREIIQNMRDDHVYFGEKNEKKIKWQRVFSVPQTSIDTKIDPYNAQEFIKKTDRQDSLGSLWDRSKELSEKRKDHHGGVDPVQEKYFEDYSKLRKGKRHPLDNRKVNKKSNRKFRFGPKKT